MSSMWTSSMKDTGGAISALPSSRHSDTFGVDLVPDLLFDLSSVATREQALGPAVDHVNLVR